MANSKKLKADIDGLITLLELQIEQLRLIKADLEEALQAQAQDQAQAKAKADATQAKAKADKADKAAVFPFGKYKGKTVEQVLSSKEGRTYLEWFVSSIEPKTPLVRRLQNQARKALAAAS